MAEVSDYHYWAITYYLTCECCHWSNVITFFINEQVRDYNLKFSNYITVTNPKLMLLYIYILGLNLFVVLPGVRWRAQFSLTLELWRNSKVVPFSSLLSRHANISH